MSIWEHLGGKFIAFFFVLARKRLFRVAIEVVSVTVYCACAQKLASNRGE